MTLSKNYNYQRIFPDIEADLLRSDSDYQRVMERMIFDPELIEAEAECLKRRNPRYAKKTPFEADCLWAAEYVKCWRYWAGKRTKKPLPPSASPLWAEWWQSPQRNGIRRARQEFDRRGFAYNAATWNRGQANELPSALNAIIEFYVVTCHRRFPPPNQLFRPFKAAGYQRGIERRQKWQRENGRTVKEARFDLDEDWDGMRQIRMFLSELDCLCSSIRRCGENEYFKAYVADQPRIDRLVAEAFDTDEPHTQAMTQHRRAMERQRRAKATPVQRAKEAQRLRDYRAKLKDAPEAQAKSRAASAERMRKKRALDKIAKELPADAGELWGLYSQVQADGTPADDMRRQAIEREIKRRGITEPVVYVPAPPPRRTTEDRIELVRELLKSGRLPIRLPEQQRSPYSAAECWDGGLPHPGH